MAQVPILRVFISSPGDVVSERKLALEVIERFPDRPAFREKVAFRVIAWDKIGADTPMIGTLTPQEAINQGLPKPSECDIVIVIFWSRIGTPFFDTDGKEYLSGTHWELLDGINADKPQTIIYRRTDSVTFSLDQEDKRDQYQKLQKFFESDLFYKEGRIARGVNTYETPNDFRRKFETHFESLVVNALQHISESTEHLVENQARKDHIQTDNVKTVVTKTWKGSPFPGLRPFNEDDAPIFFGRGLEIDQLTEHLSKKRFLAVVGDSGSGKSSLVKAGLIPRLRANAIFSETTGSKDWFYIYLTPGKNPFEKLASELIDSIPALNCNDPIDYPERVDKLTTSLRSKPDRLSRTIEFALKNEKSWAEVLIFIDQFEELLSSSDDEIQQLFTQMLSINSDKIRIVLTIRADFYHKVVHLLESPLRFGTYTLGRPSSISIYEMITRPAEKANLTFEKGLAEKIVDNTGTDSGSLALLAYALDELYKLSQSRNDHQISFIDYEQLGGVQGAIGKRAEIVFEKLSGDEKLIRKIFYQLVEVNEQGTATRTRVSIDKVIFDPESEALVNGLAEARLLVRTTLQGLEKDIPAIEVAHDSLFKSWQLLQQIVDSIQDDLILLRQVKQASNEWQQRNKDNAFLWPHERLVFVYEMLDRLDHIQLSPLVRDFIRPEQERLIEEIEDISTSHTRRSSIGQRLDIISDSRAGIYLNEIGLPDIFWLPVAGGEIQFNQNSYKIPSFFIAKYQITHAQFQAFVDDGGYDNDQWWQGIYHRETTPPDQQTSYLNHPRDSIRWTDAVAFCRWLDYKSRNHPNLLPEEITMAGNWEIRLPLEWEWEIAATGGISENTYPWGGKWDMRKTNTREAGLSQTTAVGLYPHGASPCGALDMSGNICEWCYNAYEDTNIIDPSIECIRVRKGGSCNHYYETASTSYRFNYDPGYTFSHDLGFRIVLASRLKI